MCARLWARWRRYDVEVFGALFVVVVIMTVIGF